MPKSPVANHAGNVNMKGKKYKLLRCNCCVCMDFRDRELEKVHKKEMRDQVAQLNRASVYETEG